MKTIVFLFLLLLLNCSSACHDDDNACENLNTNIIGIWTVYGYFGGTAGDVEFLNDGTLLDPNGAIIALAIHTIESRSFEVKSNSILTILAKVEGDPFPLQIDYNVKSSDCSEILLQFGQNDMTLIRK